MARYRIASLRVAVWGDGKARNLSGRQQLSGVACCKGEVGPEVTGQKALNIAEHDDVHLNPGGRQHLLREGGLHGVIQDARQAAHQAAMHAHGLQRAQHVRSLRALSHARPLHRQHSGHTAHYY